jgi:predicted chitinase
MLKIYAFGAHDIQQDLEGNDDVRVDDRSRLVTLFLWETSAMNNPHLLDNGGLARFSRTCPTI